LRIAISTQPYKLTRNHHHHGCVPSFQVLVSGAGQYLGWARDA
jgi:hypothetical protein